MKTFFLPVFLLIFFISFFRLGSVTLFDVDEAVFAQATKEMVNNKNFITPTYNGENRYDKPILFYWLMAITYKIFGINEFAARLPSAIAGFILCIFLFLFLRRYDKQISTYSIFFFSFTPYFLVYSHAAVTDMVLTLFVTLSLLSFYLFIYSDKRYIYGFYAFSALAFLTKGLIGILFPFTIGIIYLILKNGLKGLAQIVDLKAFLLFMLIAFPWYIAQIFINGTEFLQAFFLKHHFRRYTDVISGHSGPIYYYLLVIIIGMFPWIAFMPQAMLAIFNKSLHREPLRSLTLFAFIWFIFIFLFFSFSKTKLPNYILPAIPAISIIISAGITEEEYKLRRFSWLLLAIMASLLAIAFMISEGYMVKFGISDIYWMRWIVFIMVAMALLSIYGLLVKKLDPLVLLIPVFVFLMILSLKALPSVNQYLQGTLYKYSIYARGKLNPEEKIIMYRINAPSVVFYSERKAVYTGDIEGVLANVKGRLLIARSRDRDFLKAHGFQLLEDDGRYALFQRK
ncbi:MAG: glycosyltransferase family 39 protein [Thermodesulfovibrionales bacterium]|nr:glycosyltransferase family 39 protein [Thermodesulfovibrionales bacterium]